MSSGLARRLSRGAATPGVVDSGASSLATFLVGLVAVRYLATNALGSYALAYSAFLLATAVPAVLVFTPVEAQAVAEAGGRRRLAILRASLSLGLPTAVLSSVLVAGLVLAVPSSTPVGTLRLFAGTLLVLSAISPLQDHLRRMLHSADRSWDAATTSGIQAITVGVLLGLLLALGQGDRPWVPFGVLAAANVVSTGWALLRCRHVGPPLQIDRARVRRQGSTLLVGALALFSANFAILALVTVRAGVRAVAQVEAVRLVSQPMTVLVVGLLAVYVPRVMTSALIRPPRATHRLVGRALLLLSVLTALYDGAVSIPWRGGPLEALVPRAFEDRGLLAVMVVVQVASYSTFAYRSIPVALRCSFPVLVVEGVSAIVGLGVTALLISHGAWSAVLGGLAGTAVLAVGFAGVSVVLLRRRATDPAVACDPRAAAEVG